ncbi:MAG: hypothetical protein NTV01_01175, partial [Bacteroidia bacterium]|nr:hypothetical protein [Bacteroidia bacterium]
MNSKWLIKPFLWKLIRQLCIVASIVLVLFQSSCAPTKCVVCDLGNRTLYNVELNDSAAGLYGKKNFTTYFSPVPVERSKGKFDVYVVDCEGQEPFRLSPGPELRDFVKTHMIVIDSTTIKRITKFSDADIYPEEFKVPANPMCGRQRNPFKVELRAMLGVRSFEKTQYAVLLGDTPIDKKVFGFGPEGTTLNTGLEIGLLAPIFKINNKHRFHLGIMTGYWPVEGGNFIPMSIHPRFTFNDITSPIWGTCNAVYLFGDYGTAYDVSGGAEKFRYNKRFNSSFWDVG